MRYKKSKAIYLTVLMLLSCTALIDRLNHQPEAIQIMVSGPIQNTVTSSKYTSLTKSTNQNKTENEKVNNLDPDTSNN